MKRYLLVALGFLFFLQGISAQVGINILVPDSTAVLHLESTEKGFLPPRMTEAQRDAINNPATGLTVYNTDVDNIQYWNGTCWISAFQQDCDDCIFSMDMVTDTATIDRTLTDSVGTDIIIAQTGGTPTNIGLFILSNLPAGITAYLDNYAINGSGTVHLTVEADVFAPPGTYPIIVQGVCNQSISNTIFIVEIEPCIIVDLTSSVVNYDLQAANGLPTSTPICVILNLFPGVEVTNSSATVGPALTTGNLHPQSNVGINIDNGAIIAYGGDGGVGGNFSTFGNPGFDGSDALNLTVRSSIIVNGGYVFGGGGGGGSVGVGVTLPIIGTWALGSGGGGGAQLGLGGDANGINLPIFDAGQDATGGITGQGGDGGEYTLPISIPISGVTLTVNPNINGGDGGDYGVDGTAGNLFVNLQVAVPFLGTIFNQDFPDPPVTNFPAGGQAGNAIKRNGNNLNGLTDGYYQTISIRGQVGN